jgi:hypothetical protein
MWGVQLTSLPPSCADCLEIWEPQPAETLKGLSRHVQGLKRESVIQHGPILMFARSKVWVCGRSLAEIAVSNPAGDFVSVSWECCVLSGSGFCVGLNIRPEDSYRTWCVWVWSWSVEKKETLEHQGLFLLGGKKQYGVLSTLWSRIKTTATEYMALK